MIIQNRIKMVFTCGLMLAFGIGCPLLTGSRALGWRFADGVFISGTDVTVIPSGGYLVGGEAQFTQGGLIYSYALRLNDSGEVVWSTSDNSPVAPVFNGGFKYVNRNQEGGAILTGVDRNFSKGRSEALLQIQNLDVNGDLSWENTYSRKTFVPTDVCVGGNGSFLIAGMLSNGTFSEEGLLAQLSADGSVYNEHSFDALATRFVSCAPIEDGSFVAIGWTGLPDLNDGISNLILWIVDGSGALVSTFLYEDQSFDSEPTSVSISPGGGFLTVGTKEQTATIWRIGADGTLLDTKSFLGSLSTETRESHECWDIAVNTDGTMIVVGLQQFTTIGAGGFFVGDDNRNFVIKLDADANIIWRKDIPNVALYGCDVGPEGTIAVTGSAGDDLALILLDQSGNIIN